MNFIIICSLDHQLAQHQLWIIIELKSLSHQFFRDILEGMLNELSKRTQPSKSGIREQTSSGLDLTTQFSFSWSFD